MPQVSIITRTKDRPITLHRALGSVSSQIFRDFEWIIVNDGGNPKPVDMVADLARKQGMEVRILHHPESMGMEAASNAGLRCATGELVAIHDDDDSWSTKFLDRTVSYLQQHRKEGNVRGVVSRSILVEEIINQSQEAITKVGERPYDDSLHAVTLFHIARLNNIFPPISFLYEKKVLNEIGYYREDLHVLGDWEFNLRFLEHYDIGVVPEYLANYHIRKSDMMSEYSNSIIGDFHKHKYFRAKICNELLRKDIASNRIGTGFIVNLCTELQDMQQYTSNHSVWLLLYRKVKSYFISILTLIKRSGDK